jgi:hypothetical protein
MTKGAENISNIISDNNQNNMPVIINMTDNINNGCILF